ncbi:MAG: alpha/beta hydrolase [Treponema sp.]|nr:alpha/beta hydrolase [Treponema sp.]
MKLLKKLCVLASALFIFNTAVTARTFRTEIWNDVPSMRKYHVSMYCTIPENHNGSAVIILAGGSYHHLGYRTEGKTTAAWFNEQGTCTFILNYRVAGNGYHYPAMMEDVQKAILYVRQNARNFGIDKNRIATIGFSAGGHLSCWSGEFGNRTNELEKFGIIPTESIRPSIVISVYPVVTMQQDIGHEWSRESLLGENPTQEQRDLFSLEMNVPDDMPPTYVIACHDDPVVIYENSVRLANALKEKNIDYRFIDYPIGGHGFAMIDNDFMKQYHWNADLKLWLDAHNFFTAE